MEKQCLNSVQAAGLVVVITIANNVILGMPLNVERDSWISLLLSLVLVLPLVCMYARMMRLMPGKDFFEMLDACWGRTAGAILSVAVCWYPLHLTAMVLRNFAEFVHITSLQRTPLLVVLTLLFLACLYLAKSGIGTLGRWMGIMLPITLFTILFISVTSYNIMDFSNLFPILEHPISEVALGAAKLIPYPFGECCMILALAGHFKKEVSPYKTFCWGTLASAFILLTIFLRTLCVLGIKTLDTVYFPTYRAGGIIHAGAFLERIESLISFIYILAGITKAALCIIAAARGFAHGLRLSSYRKTAGPAGMLALALSAIVFKNTVDMFNFVEIYQIYVLPFQILLPMAMWLTAEFKRLRVRREQLRLVQQGGGA